MIFHRVERLNREEMGCFVEYDRIQILGKEWIVITSFEWSVVVIIFGSSGVYPSILGDAGEKILQKHQQ